MKVGQLSAFRWPHATVRPEEDGLLNIENGNNMIGAKCYLLTTPDSIWSVTSDVFWYGGKEAFEITPYSFLKGHNIDKLVGWGGISIGKRTDLHINPNGTLTARRYANEILRPHVIPYVQPLEIPLFSSMIMPDRILLVLWKTCLKLNQYSAWNDQHALLTWIQSSMSLLWDQNHLLLSEIWRFHFFRSGTVFPQILINNIIASTKNKCAPVLDDRGDHMPY